MVFCYICEWLTVVLESPLKHKLLKKVLPVSRPSIKTQILLVYQAACKAPPCLSRAVCTPPQSSTLWAPSPSSLPPLSCVITTPPDCPYTLTLLPVMLFGLPGVLLSLSYSVTKSDAPFQTRLDYHIVSESSHNMFCSWGGAGAGKRKEEGFREGLQSF